MRKSIQISFAYANAAALAITLAACRKTEVREQALAAAHPHHEHVPPHGGTPVELGEEQNHLELVLDKSNGVMDAYVMDGELENFVRVDLPEITIQTKVPAHPEITLLLLKPVGNHATGEKIGDTSLFEAKEEWLKTATNFEGKIARIRIKGTTYEHVEFQFPQGREGEKAAGNN